MRYKRIGLDKPVYIFILIFIILFSYTVLSHNPPEQMYENKQVDSFEPTQSYNDKNINETTDIYESISVIEVRKWRQKD